ncbi:hypothetical protein [Paractinoplanes toevensis]|uniref:Uncharacterized protein n=1 Tax=Paractinoplanes toevensis TaxID=571911 RepID=A0A919W0W2_9ACTN|nr:hypothetical protein [Actinoplanes toevensis]GIM89704.1 hypothetical protein Ato02nite_014970 [Actinoplanes toevensis]
MTAPTTELTSAVDRDGFFWVRDDEDGDWYAYANEDLSMPYSRLLAEHGPLEPAVHERNPAPGPVPGPIPGVCFACGNTGEIYHGPGIDGPVWGGECGCDTEHCGTCGDAWPCSFSGEFEKEGQ